MLFSHLHSSIRSSSPFLSPPLPSSIYHTHVFLSFSLLLNIRQTDKHTHIFLSFSLLLNIRQTHTHTHTHFPFLFSPSQFHKTPHSTNPLPPIISLHFTALVSNLYFLSQLLYNRYSGVLLVRLLGVWKELKDNPGKDLIFPFFLSFYLSFYFSFLSFFLSIFLSSYFPFLSFFLSFFLCSFDVSSTLYLKTFYLVTDAFSALICLRVSNFFVSVSVSIIYLSLDYSPIRFFQLCLYNIIY